MVPWIISNTIDSYFRRNEIREKDRDRYPLKIWLTNHRFGITKRVAGVTRLTRLILFTAGSRFNWLVFRRAANSDDIAMVINGSVGCFVAVLGVDYPFLFFSLDIPREIVRFSYGET